MRSPPLLLGLAIAMLAACQDPVESTRVVPAPSSLSPPVDVNAVDQQALAFVAAWGGPPPVQSSPGAPCHSDCFTFLTGRLAPLGGERYAFVSSGQGNDSHASSGALAIHYVERTASGFRRLPTPPLVIEAGQFGIPPEWSIQAGLLASPALVTDSVGTGQGYTCSSAVVVELMPERPAIRTDAVRLSFSNGGAVEDPRDVQEMEGRLLPGASGREFVVQYFGASTARVVWRLGENGLYKPVNEPADLPWC